MIHGNRQQAVVNAATNSYTAISNGVPVAPTYDDDGNMTACNGWTYVWNGENRLVLASNNQHVVEYVYDHIGRMVQKKSNGETVGYIWDGYNIIAEVGAASTTYNVWGLDLSGSMQGAGGVGGLLAVSRNGQLFAAAYDANGNITEYVNAAGSIAASRTYGPFGETVGITGAAGTFTHWWSTKPWDNETGFSEYEYRMFSAELGRWPNRDPIEEQGGINLYSYVLNSSVNYLDYVGLAAESYDFSIYLGVGPARGNDLIRKAAQIAAQYKADYKAPEDASKNCRFTIENNISSGALRAATAEYDEVHFYGHGVKHGAPNPKWKRGDPADQKYIWRTALAFSDGDKYLSDVLSLAPEKVKASNVTTWVCYDMYVDTENPSGIAVCKPVNSADPILSVVLHRILNEIIATLREKKCCAPLK